MEGKEFKSPQNIPIIQGNPTPSLEPASKKDEKYRALKRKFKILRDVFLYGGWVSARHFMENLIFKRNM